jgi:hypothetical protein
MTQDDGSKIESDREELCRLAVLSRLLFRIGKFAVICKHFKILRPLEVIFYKLKGTILAANSLP